MIRDLMIKLTSLINIVLNCGSTVVLFSGIVIVVYVCVWGGGGVDDVHF